MDGCNNDIVLAISSFLSSRDLVRLALTCRRFGARTAPVSAPKRQGAPAQSKGDGARDFAIGSTVFASVGGSYAEGTVCDRRTSAGFEYYHYEYEVAISRGAKQWIPQPMICSLECMIDKAEELLTFFVVGKDEVFSNAKAVARALRVYHTFVEAIARRGIASFASQPWSLMEGVAFQRAMDILDVEHAGGCFEWKEGVSWMGISDRCEREMHMLNQQSEEMAEDLVDDKSLEMESTMARIDHFMDAVARVWAEYVTEELRAHINSGEHGDTFQCTKKLSQWLGVPEGLVLTQQQAYSIHQLVCRYENGFGTLTDDVVSGRIQLIALFAFLRRMEVYGPFIVVAPSSSVATWMNEFQRWAPSIPTLCLTGMPAEREAIYSRLAQIRSDNEFRGNFPVIVTSYEVAVQDQVRLVDIANQWRESFAYSVVEVGKRVSGQASAILSTVKRIPSSNRILLSAPSFQNDPVKMWSIFEFLYANFSEHAPSQKELSACCSDEEWMKKVTVDSSEILWSQFGLQRG